jgi:hypothetical protein
VVDHSPVAETAAPSTKSLVTSLAGEAQKARDHSTVAA